MQGQTKNSHPIGRLQYEDMFCIEGGYSSSSGSWSRSCSLMKEFM